MIRKNRWKARLFAAVATTLLLPSVISAGGYLLVSKGGVIYKWDNTTPIPQHIDGGNFGILVGAAAANFAEDAILIWSDEPTLALSFTLSTGTLVADGNVNTLAEFLSVAAAGNGKSPVIFDNDGAIFSALGVPPGVIGMTVIKNRDDTNFRITESLQMYNGLLIDGNAANGELPLDEMAIAITHEMGHALNFDHMQVNGHYFIGDTDDPGFALYGAPPAGAGVVNIMFPFAIGGGNVSETPNRDDLATAELLYGNGTGAAGKISGVVFEADGSSHLQGANIIARNSANPFFDAVSCVSGYLYWPSGPGSGFAPASLKGKYDLVGLTPQGGASYTVEKVRVHPTFRFGSSVGPLDVPVYFDVEEFYNGAEESADGTSDSPLAFVHVSASASGINLIANEIAGKIELGDDDVAEVALPFSFPFCGNSYNSVFVHSNGFLTFGAPSNEQLFGAFESVTDLLTDPPRIAPLWDDLNPSSAGTVTALADGPDFVIAFSDVPEYAPVFGAGGSNSFVVRLRPDGSFRIDYGSISATDGLAGRSQGQFATDPGVTDLSAASQPIKSTNPTDAIYEIFNLLTGTPNDLSESSLEFAPCNLTPAPPIEPAVPGVCYASTGSGSGNAGSLLSFSPATGTAAAIGTSGYSGISGLAINSSGEMLGVTTGGPGSYLLRISATTGYTETVALMTSGAQPAGSFEALAFSENDILFGIDWQNDFYTIDPASGIATKVGATGIDPSAAGVLAGMAFEPNSGRLFASSGQNGSGSDEIYEIDPATGQATLIGKTGLGSGTDALVFIDGNLFGSSALAGQSSLIKIDMATGTGTVVGAFGFEAVHGLACFGAQSLTVLEYVLLAKEDIKIARNRVSEGKIHSNQSVHFNAGKSGTHTGNISAVGRITIEKNNTIVGDATTGKKLFLFGNATVTGVKTENASVNPVTVQEQTFTANNAHQTVPKKGTLVLAPGIYGKVKALKHSELRLSTGNYFMEELDTDRKARLIIDVAAGPVNIYVTDDLEFDDGAEVEILPSGQNGTRLVTFTTLQKHKVDFGKSSLVLGSILAPKAKVRLSRGSVFKGAIYAKSINVQKEVPFFHHDALTALPKPLPDQDVNSVQYTVASFQLMQNYPNPFNPSTVIRFQLPVVSDVELTIYSMTGQVVRELVNSEMPLGQHSVVWDATDDHGQRVASGVYVYRIVAGEFVAQRKLVLMK